jgi:hypothetical protein
MISTSSVFLFRRRLGHWKNEQRRGPRTRCPAIVRHDALEPRLAPAVINVPGDWPTLAMALSNGLTASTDAANTIVLGAGTSPVANQMVSPFVVKINNTPLSRTIVGQGQKRIRTRSAS